MTVQLQPWAQHFPVDWVERLTESLATIQQTIWERRPTLAPDGLRGVLVTLDTFGFSPTDASLNAETLMRRHLPLAGLMAGDYTISITSAERPQR